MKRNRLSVRVPRKTSVARTVGFNRIQLTQYCDEFTPDRIYNKDETGVQTVPNKLPLHVAPKGKREVAKTVAAEQGQTVTAVCAMNALGHYVPPYFIYARKRENRQLLQGGPIGCDMAVTDKGYMNTPTFIKWLEHFIKHTNPCIDNPVLLILDNHVSHKSLEAVTLAKSKHVHLLTLPPHSSHKTQPLDRCFLGPLKGYYDTAVDSWDVCNPGQTFDVYSVASAFRIAFEKAGTIATAAQGFKSTGIVPFDPQIFTEADFLPSKVTDQQLPEVDCDNDDVMMVGIDEIEGPDSENNVNQAVVWEEISSNLGSSTPAVTLTQEDNRPRPIQECDDYSSTTGLTPTQYDSQPTLRANISPQEIIPLPKIKIMRKRSGKALKSLLLTSTPIKERMEEEVKEKEKLIIEKERRAKERKALAIEAKRHKLDFTASMAKEGRKQVKQPLHDSSESESDFSVHDSSSDLDMLLLSSDSVPEEEERFPGRIRFPYHPVTLP